MYMERTRLDKERQRWGDSGYLTPRRLTRLSLIFTHKLDLDGSQPSEGTSSSSRASCNGELGYPDF